ncbi:hypothetical protein LPJ56_000343 [Coemansia sp. RSA 2599]|nr:hypothetical protein LPJ56_000343 [Coemansia sp. RSA 2599]
MVAVASVGAVAVADPEANPAADAAQNSMLKRAPCGCGGCGSNWGWGWNRCGGCGGPWGGCGCNRFFWR